MKFLFTVCTLLFLSACSSTPSVNSEPFNSASDTGLVVSKNKQVDKSRTVKTEEYIGVEIVSSCLNYVIIKDEQFIGYQPRYFNFDETISIKKADKQMSCIAGLLIDYPEQLLEVRGYTDDKGSFTYNLILSEARSISIIDELLALGVAKKQLSPVALGKSKPWNQNLTAQESALNRRVEFILVN